MQDINQLLEELEQLTNEGSANSIQAAQNARSVAENAAERAEYIAKATRSAEVVRFRDEGKPVAEAEHRARISPKYEEKKEIEFKTKLSAEQAKARHQALLMQRDNIKTKISAIQSAMKLV